MSGHEWPANDYAIGSFIQTTVAEEYLPSLVLKTTDCVLDIGCGNGVFTKKILKQVPKGSVLGVDASENMLQLAKAVTQEYPNFLIQKNDVQTMDFKDHFDAVVSFWCLQWTNDIDKAFENIMKALKTGGQLFAIFPAGDDPYIKGYYALKKSAQFPSLENFVAPVDYSNLENLPQKLKTISCDALTVNLCHSTLTLPSLEAYRKFVNGIAFFQGQVPDAEIVILNEALVNYFDNECQKNYRGQYKMHFSIYVVSGIK